MEKVKIGNYVKQIRGVSYKPNDLHNDLNSDSVILLRANNINEGKINFDDIVYVDKSKVKKEQYLKKGDILVCASSGSKELVGKAAFINKDYAVTFGAFCKLIRPKDCIAGYLGHYFNSQMYKEKISSLALGANINNIRNEHIDELLIYLPNKAEQQNISILLDEVSDLTDKRKKQLEKLDELVKPRFIEMFGDPTITNKNRTYMPMTSICKIIDGDRGKNYPKQEEFYDKEYCLFLNAKNVTSNGFDFANCMFITEEKDKLLRKGKLSRGDVVLTTRGTIGNLAYYSDDVTFDNVRINSGMVILRMNHELVNEIFFVEQFKLQLAEIKEKVASGSAQPQLPISTMNKIQMLIPEISIQNDFVSFVKQVDKSKFEIKQSLEKLELLKKALMQKYFG